MSNRTATENEIIVVWLRREFEGIWNKATLYLPQTVNYTKERIRAIIDNPNYNSEEENRLRLKLLMIERWPLVLPLLGATWQEKTLTESEFQNLKVINNDPGWNVLSDLTGSLSAVAERVTKEKGVWFLEHYVGMAAKGIYTILNSGVFDTNFILLESDDSEFTTILEGNKTAVAMYVKIYIRKDFSFNPFRVFVGHLKTKAIWQY